MFPSLLIGAFLLNATLVPSTAVFAGFATYAIAWNVLTVRCAFRSICPRCGTREFVADVETNTPANLSRTNCAKCELRCGSAD